MGYQRVIPRDLFNEADLLKCVGRLWICLTERRDHRAALSEGAGQPFDIQQNSASGGIWISNLAFGVGGKNYHLERPANSRQPWPLLCESMPDDPDYVDPMRVFDLDGNLSPEFWIFITEGKPS